MRPSTVTLALTLSLFAGVAIAAPPAPNQVAAPAGGKPAAAAQTVRFKTHIIPDVTMGKVPALTMVTPADWTVSGKVEWSRGEIVYPQPTIDALAPDGAAVRFTPGMNFAYSEVSADFIKQMNDLGIKHDYKEKNGEAPPSDLGAWYVTSIQKKYPQRKDVKLVEEKKDVAGEKAIVELRKAMKVTAPEGVEKFVIIVLTYELNGQRMREEANMVFQQMPTLDLGSSKLTLWTVVPAWTIAAPEASFAQQRPLLMAAASSVRPTPKWWNQRDQVLMQISQQRHNAAMQQIQDFGRQIAERAAFYEQMSAERMQVYRQNMAASDATQGQFLSTIHGFEIFQGADGARVFMPATFGRTFSDGRGNYVGTNDLNFVPEAGWSEWQLQK